LGVNSGEELGSQLGDDIDFACLLLNEYYSCALQEAPGCKDNKDSAFLLFFALGSLAWASLELGPGSGLACKLEIESIKASLKSVDDILMWRSRLDARGELLHSLGSYRSSILSKDLSVTKKLLSFLEVYHNHSGDTISALRASFSTSKASGGGSSSLFFLLPSFAHSPKAVQRGKGVQFYLTVSRWRDSN